MAGMLALVGGKEWTDGCTFDRTLVEHSDASEVVVLPTGSAYEDPASLVAAARRWFADFGVGVVDGGVLTRRDAFDEDVVDRLATARMIYLAGTSPMHLRSVLKDSPAFDAVVNAWRGGAALVGTGAGADVVCDPMVDPRGGAFTVGLGLLRSMAVIPRANAWSHDKIHRTIEIASAGVAVVELPEATALVCDGTTWQVAGVADVVVHRDRRRASLADLPLPTSVV
ncbi:MAG: Type 1 glutamine amidotransferase-like domain-containing protein [Acidimicrobiia bacterium]|nr:Type 1 glutamine amidotransferase-like domain-containing protein [Acidimicrobiia bacterium]